MWSGALHESPTLVQTLVHLCHCIGTKEALFKIEVTLDIGRGAIISDLDLEHFKSFPNGFYFNMSNYDLIFKMEGRSKSNRNLNTNLFETRCFRPMGMGWGWRRGVLRVQPPYFFQIKLPVLPKYVFSSYHFSISPSPPS